MSKRDTIIVAVLINVGGLVLIFISALKTHHVEEHKMLSQHVSIEEKVVEKPAVPVVKVHTEEVPIQLAPKQEVQQILEKQESKPNKKVQDLVEVVVKQGDTLEKIARRNMTTIDELMSINGLTSSRLQIGQILYCHPGKKEQ